MTSKLANFLMHFNRSYGADYFNEWNNYKKSICDSSSLAPSVTRSKLEQNGIVQLESLPTAFTELLAATENLEASNLILKRDTNCADGVKERFVISLSNTMLQEYIEKQVKPCITGYLDKGYVMRGNPRVIYNVPTIRQPADRFHIDYGFHQLTLQVLLNDVSEDDTHMEYIKGSNHSSWFHPRATLFTAKEPTTFKEKLERVKLIGTAGTAFLFDAGNGYHRANTSSNPKCDRRKLSINFSASTHLHLSSDTYEPYKSFESDIVADSPLYEPFKAN